MHLLCLLLTVVTAAGTTAGPLRPSWEAVYDGGRHAVVGPVHAMGRDDWIASLGRRGLVMARAGAVVVDDTRDHGVLGFFADAPGSLFALGEGELIWHFDGKAWTEEHVAPRPPRGRRPFAAHMLYVGYLDGTAKAPRPVAVGLELALVRQANGTWASPPPAERARLSSTGLLGPAFPPPSGCARAGWRWLTPRAGAFSCHDGRLFAWDAGVVTARGKLPGPCADVLGALVAGGGDLFASCKFATLWKLEGERWRRIVAPAENGQGLMDIGSIAFAQGCLFVAGKRALWRACDL